MGSGFNTVSSPEKPTADGNKYTPRPTRLPNDVPLGLQTSYKGRISLADRFKTVDDLDGRNYLKLPRRMRKIAQFMQTPEITPKERLFKSAPARVGDSAKESKKRMTRSVVCLNVMVKRGRMSLPCFPKQAEVLPSCITLSKKVMPLIRP
jgi:hypothetical protein